MAGRNIVITGASSGLGAALAVKYAEDANRLYLCGRDRLRLEETAGKWGWICDRYGEGAVIRRIGSE